MDEEPRLSDLRLEVETLALKEDPEKIILQYLEALGNAAPDPKSQETALASLAFVIRIFDKAE